VQTILQSWAQGVRCWGSEGMQALWGAANIRILGPGLADAGFLRDTSELIGQHYEQVSSLSNSRDKSGTSTSTSWSRTTEPTLTVSDLAALPSGRAVLLSSGRRPTLLQLVPWWDRPYADAIKASQARFEPTPADTTSDQEGDNA
jgi:type IV secretory pathway TraG/TraD family ATPase VirD4